MIVPGLRTPRMTAHRCDASMTTPTPLGWRCSIRKSAICLVMRSWTWSRREYISTMRGIFDRPMTRPLGMYATAAWPKNGKQVVLAQAVEGDVLDDHHLAVVDLEDGVVDQPIGIDPVAGGQLAVHAPHARGCCGQALAIRILAHLEQDLAHGRLDRLRAVAGRQSIVGGRLVAVLANLVLHLVDQLAYPLGQRPIHRA